MAGGCRLSGAAVTSQLWQQLACSCCLPFKHKANVPWRGLGFASLCLHRSYTSLLLHSLHTCLLSHVDVLASRACCVGAQVSIMVQEHREEVGRLHEYIQGSY